MKAWQYRGVPISDRIYGRCVLAPSGCVEYTGSLDTHGYGQAKLNGRYVLVHRWVWSDKRGPIPEGMHVCHHCDNRKCISIDHLFLGTHTDNMRDKAAKGRSKNVPRGAEHKRPQAKITDQNVRDIRSYIAQGCRQCDVATFLGVSRNLISEIMLGKTWGWVA